MTSPRLPLTSSLVGAALGLLLAAPMSAGAFDLMRSEEATVADIQAAFRARTLTCRALVQMYLDRIEAYDKKGPALNAIVVTNPAALGSPTRSTPVSRSRARWARCTACR